MKDIVIVKEVCEYKGIKFGIELEYYYDEKFDDYYVDTELGNKNLKRVRNKYLEIRNSNFLSINNLEVHN